MSDPVNGQQPHVDELAHVGTVAAHTDDNNVPFIPPYSQYFFPHHPPHKRLKIDNPNAPLLDYSTVRLNAMLKAWMADDETKLVKEVGTATATVNKTNEDDEPMTAVKSLNWREITQSKFGKFSSREVFSHYCNSSGPTLNRESWTAQEEKSLLNLVEKYDEREWSCIASELGTGRSPFACLQHYQQALNRRLVNGEEWTPEEDALLRTAMEEFGCGKSNGQLIADRVPFRTVDQCINRWHKSSRRNKNSSEWNGEEERMLYLAVVAHDIPSLSGLATGDQEKPEDEKKAPRGQKWLSIAKLMDGKDDVQCREKWTNNLDPTIKSSQFTSDEDSLLIELVQEHGINSWARIAEKLPGRTDSMLRTRWAKLQSSRGIKLIDMTKNVKALPKKHSRKSKATITEREFSKTRTID